MGQGQEKPTCAALIYSKSARASPQTKYSHKVLQTTVCDQAYTILIKYMKDDILALFTRCCATTAVTMNQQVEHEVVFSLSV